MNADWASVVGMAARRIAAVERPVKSFMITDLSSGREEMSDRR